MKRRTFFGTIGAASAASAASRGGAEVGEDYYDKLGVTKIINAAGTYTALTASIMPPPVQAAVARAAKSPVRLGELQAAAGGDIPAEPHGGGRRRGIAGGRRRVHRGEAQVRGRAGLGRRGFGAHARNGGLPHGGEQVQD